ncbi:Phage tail protein [Prescottella defluvii]
MFVPGWILDDRSLAPPAVGDLVETHLTFGEAETPPASYAQTFRATARPAYGHMPGGDPESGLHWLHELSGDGWAAKWYADRPTTSRVEVHGALFADFDMGSGDPLPVRGRVRRVRVVSHRRERTPTGTRLVHGSERLTDVEATPRIFWSSQEPASEDDPYVLTGVLVDLDLDDVPATDSEFVAGAVSISGTDVWVMDRADPVLLHADTAAIPPRVVEYLLPMTAERPRDHWTRAVHADANGCWITSEHDVFRCDLGADGSVTVERLCTEGGRSVVDDGHLYLLDTTEPHMRHDRRYGTVRVDPPPHPVRVLDDARRLIPVDDPTTVARVRAAATRADIARGAGGTEWIAHGGLTAQSPSGTRESVNLDTRTRGRVHWIQPDPYADPANRALVPFLCMPIPAAAPDPE